MVKPKQQKSKLKKPTQKVIKTKGKQADISQFRAQLDTLGLKIIQVTADGNCFFRALADQLEGNEEEYEKYRRMVVQYIVENRETFEPFIEDDVPFDEYCQSMDEDGTWAGHMELQAASLVTHCNICIHRHMSPRWYIRNFDSDGARMVHLSYHDGEHYNSVRLKEDPCNGSARPIKIKVDADLSAASHQAKTAANKSEGGTVPTVINAGSIKVVMAGTGCENAERVEQALLEVGGDTDAAIEFLIAEQGGDNYPVENNLLPCHADISHGDNENGNSKQLEVEPVKKTCEQDLSSNSLKRAHEDVRSQPDDKIPRNKVCPCGSKKKYKACCGSATGRSTKFVVNQTTDFRKSRKERKQGKSGGPSKSTSSIGSDGGPPDMGALCI
ncbi:OVARIAN TUMOR DOMAIN-containing deubiquitinating enzyme 7 isoform X2 [Mangifera indica]|uniref:OVARIAN TUMOR DOMAIN-containing deubiquitinating enzyme 7 isoform X2 n=1 Tax=Mangifera indica TaxID=29780 RepID=UPI001CFB9490|nr:OVARIAN TUMOR DOMAIN-containing deubiquitinating enzyme 7 isoform X2 [Mangifera indica]